MKIAILSRNPNCYSTRRLKEAALVRGHDPKVLNTLLFGIYMEEETPQLTFAGKDISAYDGIIPRIGASITAFGTAVVRHFEQMGIYSLNPSHAISVSRDKLRALQALSRHDIGMPATAFVKRKQDVLPAIERVGGAPVIIKLLEGTQGVGVILADSETVAAAIIETLNSTQHNVLIQKFVKESKGKDIRAFVIGDKVVAAMRRQAIGQEFRSNVHRGGKAMKVELPREYERTAVHAARIMGLRVAGVDMLEGKDGPQIMEVNSSPGLQGIEAATGVDIAGKIIQFLEEQVAFDDVDIRQRLALARGYTVAEFQISPDSDLANKQIGQTNLRSQDVMVLSINRNGLVTPAPHGDNVLLPGDVVLCYGKQITLRSMVPSVDAKRQAKKTKKKTKSPIQPPDAITETEPIHPPEWDKSSDQPTNVVSVADPLPDDPPVEPPIPVPYFSRPEAQELELPDEALRVNDEENT
jgi:ribosomal protein S6--L-glutamate ligase